MAELEALDLGDGVERELRDNSAVKWADAETSVKKNKIKATIGELKSSNTTGTWTGNTYAVNGVSFAVTTDDRGYVLDISASTVSGGATGNAYLNVYGISFESGDIINGCPSGGSGTTFSQVVCSNNGQTVYATDIGDGDVINTTDVNGRCIVRVLSGTIITTPISFKPMIRPASIKDSTYAPWIPDNEELDSSKANETALAPVEDGTTASRAYTAGDHFVRGGAFCTCKVAIASGGSFTLGTNYVEDTMCNKMFNKFYTCTSTDFEDTGIEITISATTYVMVSAFFSNAAPRGIRITNATGTSIKASEETEENRGQLTVLSVLEPGTYKIQGKWATANTSNNVFYKVLT